MADKTDSITKAGAAPDADVLRAQIADTRSDMSNTIEELHGRLNPTVFKEQALGQFREAADTVKSELKAHFVEAKELVRSELLEAKATLKSEVNSEIDAAKTRIGEEMVHAKAAMREATIGKVENMVHGAQDKVRTARTSLVETVRDNPVPSALIGIGIAWLLLGRRRPVEQQTYGQGQGQGQYQGQGQDNFATRGVHALQDAAGRGAHQVGATAQRAGHAVADATSGVASSANRMAHDAGMAATHVVHDIGDAANHLAHNAGAAIGSAASRVQHTTMDLGHGAATQARRLQSQGSAFYETNPLAVGVIVLAVGAAAALALPRTHVEDELMGKARDQLSDRAQHLAHDAMDRAGDAAHHLAEDLGKADDDQGRNGRSSPNA